MCCTIVEIMIPLFLASLLLIIRQLVDTETVAGRIYGQVDLDVPVSAFTSNQTWIVGYTPVNTHTQQIVTAVAASLQSKFPSTVFVPQGEYVSFRAVRFLISVHNVVSELDCLKT